MADRHTEIEAVAINNRLTPEQKRLAIQTVRVAAWRDAIEAATPHRFALTGGREVTVSRVEVRDFPLHLRAQACAIHGRLDR